MIRTHVGAIILIAAVCAASFANALQSEFFWDDVHIIRRNPGIRDLRNAPRFFVPRYWQEVYADYLGMPGRYYRPVPELTLAIDYALWKLKPVGYHRTSVVLHTANCLLLYFFAYRLFRSRRGALFCALLFAAHPIHVEAVTWAKARSTLLALLFMLSSVHLYTRWALSGTTAGNLALYVCSVVALGTAIICKASAVMLPPLLALYIWCVIPRRKLRRAIWGLLPLVGVVAAFFAFDSVIPKQIRPPSLPLFHHLLTAISSFGFYVRLLVLPVGLCVHHFFLVVHALVVPQLLRTLPWVIAVIAGTLFAWRRSRIAFFALGWLIIASAPMSSLVFVGRPIGEQRAYVPSIGFCILVALLLHHLPVLATAAAARRALEKLGIVLCVMLVVTYVGLTVTRNMDWTTEFSLWRDTVEKNPLSDQARGALARAYVDIAHSEAAQQQFEDADAHRHEAKKHLEALLTITPTDTWALDQLGVLCDEMGLYDEAIRHYQRVLSLDPENAAVHLGLAIAYAHAGKGAEAIRRFEMARQVAPQYAEVHLNLGIFYSRAGEHTKAIAPLQEAVRLAPNNLQARQALGTAYEQTGSYEQALAEYETSLAVQPTNPVALLGAGRCYEALGQTTQAVRRYERALQFGGAIADAARERLSGLNDEATE